MKVVKMENIHHNLSSDILEAAQKVLAYKEERANINAQIKAIRSDLEAKGVDKYGFDDALKYFEKNRHERQGYNEAFALCKEALETQLDLFDRKEDI
jgi:uncharacterized protein (UPF0335 family)